MFFKRITSERILDASPVSGRAAPANQPLHLTGAALLFLATQWFTSGPGR